MMLYNFDSWMTCVEMYLEDECGMTSLDFPDTNYWDEWKAGTNPSGMCHKVIRENS